MAVSDLLLKYPSKVTSSGTLAAETRVKLGKRQQALAPRQGSSSASTDDVSASEVTGRVTSTRSGLRCTRGATIGGEHAVQMRNAVYNTGQSTVVCQLLGLAQIAW